MQNIEQVCEKAIAIISLTHDGNDLSPAHLQITECAVNGLLNEHGWQTFDTIYEDVIKGRYQPPWLHGIEHLAVDHDGYIYYKGQCVEHYDDPYDPDNRADLTDLAGRCRHLEQLGVELNTTNAIWHWERWQELGPGHPWLPIFKRRPSFWCAREPHRLLITLKDAEFFEFTHGGSMMTYLHIGAFLESQGLPDDPQADYYTGLKALGFRPLVNKQGFAFVKLKRLLKLFARFGVPHDLF